MADWVIPLVVGVLASVAGVLIGVWLGRRRDGYDRLDVSDAMAAERMRQKRLTDDEAFAKWRENFGGAGDGNHDQ